MKVIACNFSIWSENFTNGQIWIVVELSKVWKFSTYDFVWNICVRNLSVWVLLVLTPSIFQNLSNYEWHEWHGLMFVKKDCVIFENGFMSSLCQSFTHRLQTFYNCMLLFVRK